MQNRYYQRLTKEIFKNKRIRDKWTKEGYEQEAMQLSYFIMGINKARELFNDYQRGTK